MSVAQMVRYEIDDERHLVRVVDIDHRWDAYRP
jgi:mRNA-degrading endonuclease RelE of RelBE toxin-antitoxin system